MKILFAEDETDLREVVTAYLEYQGYHVKAVSNGREAVENAASDAYDTLVLDVMMPEMDGVTAIRKIRETGNTTPAIFLTAKAEVADRVVWIKGNVAKPFQGVRLEGVSAGRVEKFASRPVVVENADVAMQDM